MSVSISLCLCGQRSQRSQRPKGKDLRNVIAVVPENAKQSAASALNKHIVQFQVPWKPYMYKGESFY